MCIICKAPQRTWASSLQWKPWLFSVSEKQTSGCKFHFTMPHFAPFNGKKQQSHLLRRTLWEAIAPLNLKLFQGKLRKMQAFCDLDFLLNKRSPKFLMQNNEIFHQVPFKQQFCKGQGETAGFSVRLNRFCLESNNQFTVLDLEGTSILRTNNVRFYSLHINCALAVCIQMKPKHE